MNRSQLCSIAALAALLGLAACGWAASATVARPQASAAPSATSRTSLHGSKRSALVRARARAAARRAAARRAAAARAALAPAIPPATAGFRVTRDESGQLVPATGSPAVAPGVATESHGERVFPEIHRPDGAVGLDLQGGLQDYVMVRRGPDGRYVVRCMPGGTKAPRDTVTAPAVEEW